MGPKLRYPTVLQAWSIGDVSASLERGETCDLPECHARLSFQRMHSTRVDEENVPSLIIRVVNLPWLVTVAAAPVL
jgi:hypothetical protein